MEPKNKKTNKNNHLHRHNNTKRNLQTQTTKKTTTLKRHILRIRQQPTLPNPLKRHPRQPPKHKTQKRTNRPLHHQSHRPRPPIPHPKQIPKTLHQQNPKTQPHLKTPNRCPNRNRQQPPNLRPLPPTRPNRRNTLLRPNLNTHLQQKPKTIRKRLQRQTLPQTPTKRNPSFFHNHQTPHSHRCVLRFNKRHKNHTPFSRPLCL